MMQAVAFGSRCPLASPDRDPAIHGDFDQAHLIARYETQRDGSREWLDRMTEHGRHGSPGRAPALFGHELRPLTVEVDERPVTISAIKATQGIARHEGARFEAALGSGGDFVALKRPGAAQAYSHRPALPTEFNRGDERCAARRPSSVFASATPPVRVVELHRNARSRVFRQENLKNVNISMNYDKLFDWIFTKKQSQPLDVFTWRELLRPKGGCRRAP